MKLLDVLKQKLWEREAGAFFFFLIFKTFSRGWHAKDPFSYISIAQDGPSTRTGPNLAILGGATCGWSPRARAPLEN